MMLSKLRRHLTYANVVSTICLFVVLGGSAVAATVITGKNVKDNSLTGKDIKNSSLTGADLRAESINSDDVGNGSLLGEDFAPGQLPQGPKGDKGDTGAQGEPGSDASINGVAAGGDLAGTYPNPTVADGAITTAKLASGTQQATIMNLARGQYYDNNAGAIGPLSGPHRLLVDCNGNATGGMAIILQNFDTSPGGGFPPPNGKVHGVYVRGTNTVKRFDNDLRGQGWVASGNVMVDTGVDPGGTGNDSGMGSFIAHTPTATVSGTFSYLADATHCELLASMELLK